MASSASALVSSRIRFHVCSPRSFSCKLPKITHRSVVFEPQKSSSASISMAAAKSVARPVSAFASSSTSSPLFSHAISSKHFPLFISEALASLGTILEAIVVTFIHKFSNKIAVTQAGLDEVAKINSIGKDVVVAAGPSFFAAARDRPGAYINTPLTVVAAGMAKWLDIYSGVLMVRVLLSWFPNIPWDRQPLSAIRDLCDPFLNLFRNIIPPLFNAIDVSPLLAFAVLGTLGSILKQSRGI